MQVIKVINIRYVQCLLTCGKKLQQGQETRKIMNVNLFEYKIFLGIKLFDIRVSCYKLRRPNNDMVRGLAILRYHLPPSLRRSYQFDKIAHLDHKSVGHNGQDNLHISSSIHYRRLSHCAHHHDVCKRRQRSPFNSLFIEQIDVLCSLLTVYPGKQRTVNAMKRWMAACKHIFLYIIYFSVRDDIIFLGILMITIFKSL